MRIENYRVAACVLGLMGGLLAEVPNAQAEPGLYVGASIGASKDAVLYQDESVAFELGAGFMPFENLAFELSYLYAGVSEIDFNEDITVSGLTTSLVAILPVVDTLSLFAKIGLYHWEAEGVVRDRWGNDLWRYEVDSASDLLYGFGLQFGVADQVAVVAQYQAIPFEDANDQTAAITSLGLRLVF